MWHYALVFLFVVAALSLVPKLLEGDLSASKVMEMVGYADDEQTEQASDAGGRRVHKVDVSRNGSFVTEARINGRFVEMLIDTGASSVALPEKAARSAGIFLKHSDFNVPVKTANGMTYGARSNLRELKMGRVRLKNVDVLVLRDNALSQPLLGMSALSQLKRFDISNDTMVLIQ
ncbi:retropepsin-like aspartic protease family protein [Roseibium algae]|uniref:TIGR02281 family clan AA aspartic protease n=1 Tax=Roseibium algae TaxID=3123038 RepID=A0ABU8TPW8_9HYPH